jgi:hypothetical protein
MYFDNNEIFQKGLMKLLGVKKKNYEKVIKYQTAWANRIEKKEFSRFNMKKHLILN